MAILTMGTRSALRFKHFDCMTGRSPQDVMMDQNAIEAMVQNTPALSAG